MILINQSQCPLVDGKGGDIPTIEQDSAGGGLSQAHEQLQYDGFTGARLTKQHKIIAFIDCKGHILQTESTQFTT
jgi:hypothetical protein